MSENDKRYQRIAQKLTSVGMAIPGTIRETYLSCGKDGCACSGKNATLHGPYYFWNRKVDGKLTSKSIPKDKLHFYNTWIGNRQQLEAILLKLLARGQEIATNYNFENHKIKLKKSALQKRGT